MFETNGGYTPKDLVFGKDGRSRLIDGVQKMSNAVKSTLGPGGNTVLIESPHHTHGITVTKDGVTVAKSIDLFDPVENLAVKMMKEAADRTATVAGDGTTTSIILTESMVVNGTACMGVDGVNRTEVLREMNRICGDIIGDLRTVSRRVTKKMVVDVATISANNDRVIGKLIADAYNSVGRSGVVTVERSQTGDTYSEVTNGMKIDRGYSSNLFINDHSKDECAFDDAIVLVSDIEINSVLQIESIIKPVIQEGKKLLIIAPCSQNVLNTIAANVMKGNIKACVIAPPSFGYKQHELMQDIAISVGATYFSEKTGDDLSLINYSDLGNVSKVIVSNDSTILTYDVNSNNEQIKDRVDQLWKAHANAKKKGDKDFILQRIASLSGGIGVIYVGGNTDLEQKELYDRIDDAVCAVRSALMEGILPGAGKALFEIGCGINYHGDDVSKETKIAAEIMATAIKTPLMQILDNSGINYNDVYKGDVPSGHGYNVKSGKMGSLIDMGVIDPAKVTMSALQNAVSVATTILSTDAIVTMGRSFEISNIQK